MKSDINFESQESSDIIRKDLFPSSWPTLRSHGWIIVHTIVGSRTWWLAKNEKTGQHTEKSRPIAAVAAWDILSL